MLADHKIRRAFLFAFLLPLGSQAIGADSLANESNGAVVKDAPQPFSADCVKEAEAIVLRASTTPPSEEGPALRPVGDDIARSLSKVGINRGKLKISSSITPPSTYSLVQLSPSGLATVDDRCALDDTYLAFRQGGLVPQPTKFFGPLKPRGT